jgi:HPt (histidine-containing phosphotransfer) domain-containing protein
MTQATIDPATFRTLQETAGAEFVDELARTFLEEAPLMLAELESAFAAGDADRFRRAAHSLKSNGNTFGALVLGGLARELELAGLASVRATGRAGLDELAREYERVARALGELAGA